MEPTFSEYTCEDLTSEIAASHNRKQWHLKCLACIPRMMSRMITDQTNTCFSDFVNLEDVHFCYDVLYLYIINEATAIRMV